MSDTPSERAYGAANDLEADLCLVIDQYKLAEATNFSPLHIARYFIRQYDNFRETFQEVDRDNASNTSTMEG